MEALVDFIGQSYDRWWPLSNRWRSVCKANDNHEAEIMRYAMCSRYTLRVAGPLPRKYGRRLKRSNLLGKCLPLARRRPHTLQPRHCETLTGHVAVDRFVQRFRESRPKYEDRLEDDGGL